MDSMGFTQKAVSLILTGVFLALTVLPDLPEGSPVPSSKKGDVGDERVTVEQKEASGFLGKLARRKRNARWYHQNPTYMSWYQYFTDTGNQEGIYELDKAYLKYLQNKNRDEARRSYRYYVQHLQEAYASGAKCDPSKDPHCAHYLSTKGVVRSTPAPPPAPLKPCDPRRDPYCLPYTSPRRPPVTYYYYAQPQLSSTQRAEIARLCDPSDIRCIQYYFKAYGYRAAVAAVPVYVQYDCDPYKDPSCSHKPAKRDAYNYPNCDPDYDPYCIPPNDAPLDKSSAHRDCDPLYDPDCHPLSGTRDGSVPDPDCDPETDPYCRSPMPRFRNGMRVDCDPYYDPYCQENYKPKDEPAPEPICDPRYDPNCRSPSPEYSERKPEYEGCDPRHDPNCRTPYPMTVGKTAEGYNCYVYYDEGCYPVHASSVAREPECNPAYDPYCKPQNPSPISSPYKCDPYYDPNCRSESPQPSDSNPADCDPRYDPKCRTTQQYSPYQNCNPDYDPDCKSASPYGLIRSNPAEPYDPYYNPDGYRDGVYEPDPDCDPEYDPNCRLHRHKTNSNGYEHPPTPETTQDDTSRGKYEEHHPEHYGNTKHGDSTGYDNRGYDERYGDRQESEQRPYDGGHKESNHSPNKESENSYDKHDTYGYGHSDPRYDDPDRGYEDSYRGYSDTGFDGYGESHRNYEEPMESYGSDPYREGSYNKK
uniref:Actinodin1/2 n=1 Tax=Neoceratodus forsteri TaxID=7892 RepID=A0A7H0XJU6_NEOFS|nr:actinodin1/2 [Neoceratodus forsteri]